MMVLEKGERIVRDLKRALPFMQGLEERRGEFQIEFHLWKFRGVEHERHDRLQEEVDSLKNMTNMYYERNAQFQNEMVSVNEMIKEADRRCVQLLNEVDSMKAIMKAEHKRRAVFQKKVDSMRTMMTKKMENERRAQTQKEIDSINVMAVEDRYIAHSEQEENSVKTMGVEGENPSHSRNQVYSVESIMKAEYRWHAVLQNNVDCMKMMMTGNVENGPCAHKEIDSVKIMVVEESHSAHSQQEEDSLKIMEVEGENPTHSPYEVDSGKILKHLEEPALTEAPCQDVETQENCTVASNSRREKKKAVVTKKVQVGLAPPPNLKAVRAKVMSWGNTIHRAPKSHVKIHNEKVDYSKVQSKIKLRDNIALQGDGDKILQQNESALRPGCRKGYQVRLYCPNKIELNSANHYGRSHTE
jgi:hypothetical protein